MISVEKNSQSGMTVPILAPVLLHIATALRTSHAVSSSAGMCNNANAICMPDLIHCAAIYRSKLPVLPLLFERTS